VSVPALGDVAALGTLCANVLVASVSPDSAAESVGLEAGDLIVSVDGAPVGSFGSFAERVRTGGGQELELQVAHGGELRTVQVAPRLEEVDAGLGIKEERYLVGISGKPADGVGELELDRELNPLTSFPRAVDLTVERTQMFLAGFGTAMSTSVLWDRTHSHSSNRKVKLGLRMPVWRSANLDHRSALMRNDGGSACRPR
jgi:membrane-associated protease RseP (regulator of RpoE activity)